MPFSSSKASLRLAIVLAAGLAVTACAKNNTDEAALGGFGAGANGAATPGSPQDFAVNVGDRVFFETDQTDVNSAGQTTLDKQAQWLARYPNYAFVIEGHADERGTREYNFALGAKRAESVKEYLASRGIAGSRMRTVSYGKERPVASCNDISCWSQNRRAVTVLKGGQS